MTQELYYDVVVVGTGAAGLCAAMAARERGASVGLLEKAPEGERGGSTALTGQMRFPFSSVEELGALMNEASEQELASIAEHVPSRTEATLWDEIMEATGGQSDQELLNVHVTEAYKTALWLRGKGHQWVPSYGNPTTGNVVMLNGGGYQMQQDNFAYLDQAGVPVHHETAALELVLDDRSRVAGVRAAQPDGAVTVRAGAVVLACGGFESNAEMRARYLGFNWDRVKMKGVPYNTGDGLRMAIDIGAMSYGSWSSCHGSPQDLNRPWYSLPSVQSISGREWNRFAFPYGIMVNIQGRRFVDEASDVRAKIYGTMGPKILTQPQGVAFEIFDVKARRIGLLVDYDKATGDKDGTLEGLAAKLGIDAAGFAETVKEYNEAVEPGVVADPNPFHKDGKRTTGISPAKSNFAMPIDEPPFEGYAVCCGITFTYGGLKIDPNTGQVQHVGGWPLPGLYAAGNMVGGLWYSGYVSGSALMAACTFGRLAGGHAAQSALD